VRGGRTAAAIADQPRGRLAAAPAARAHAKVLADCIERVGAQVDCGADFVIGDGMAETDVHRHPLDSDEAHSIGALAICMRVDSNCLRQIKQMKTILN
jgi:hypothetical protein